MIGRAFGKNVSENPNLSLEDWHQRFRQQAEWTRELRHHLFAKFNLSTSAAILEVGCGSGAVLGESAKLDYPSTFGLDINSRVLFFCQEKYPQVHLSAGDADWLPFADGNFDLTYCHYLFLWLKHPLQALQEMKRVTRPGGWVATFAEPDYEGYISYPTPLAELTSLQAKSLKKQGVNTHMGRQLKQLFHQAGFRDVDCGLIAAQWKDNAEQLEYELQMMRCDLNAIGKDNLLLKFEKKMRNRDEAIYFIPTFYAFGRA